MSGWGKIFPSIGKPVETKPEVTPGAKLIDLNLALVEECRKYVGVSEEGKNNHGKMVKEFLNSVGLSEGAAWCAAFICYCIKKVEATYKLESPIYDDTGHVRTMWEKSPKDLRTTKPQVGNLIFWSKGNSQSGHIGIIVEVKDENTVITVEGNTYIAGAGVERDGDSVGYRQRVLDFKPSEGMWIRGMARAFYDAKISRV